MFLIVMCIHFDQVSATFFQIHVLEILDLFKYDISQIPKLIWFASALDTFCICSLNVQRIERFFLVPLVPVSSHRIPNTFA